MSGKAYLRIRRFRRRDATPQRLIPALGANYAPMGYTLSPTFVDEPNLSVKIDGKTIGINRWDGGDDYFWSPGWLQEARRDYVIEPGEHLLGLVIRHFHFFEQRRFGLYWQQRFSVEPGEMYTVACQYDKFHGLFVIPESFYGKGRFPEHPEWFRQLF
jgi:hypothetical protein